MVSPVDVVTALAVGIGAAVMKPLRPDPGPAVSRWGVGVGDGGGAQQGGWCGGGAGG